MLRIFITILIFTALNCPYDVFCQQPSLEINICYSDSSYNQKTDVLLTNGKNVLFNGSFRILKTFSGLDKGLYEITYTTLYNEKIKLSVFIEKDSAYQVKAEINYIDYSKHRTSIEKMRNGGFYELEYRTYGCTPFMGSAGKVRIERNNDVYTGYYFGSDTLTKQLSTADIMDVIKFEKELRKLRKADCCSCTRTTEYTVYMNGKKRINIIDGNCRWRGFEIYIERIWNESNIRKY